jgi:putative PIN family toxin of toxin-antitoxin system
MRPKVVFDCNVLLQAAAREHGPAAQCLRLVERGFISLYLSKPILREVRRILSDPVVRSKNPALTVDLVSAFLRKVAYRGNLVRDVPNIFDYPRDPEDERYIDLAAAIQADFLLTRDKDLLDLTSAPSLLAKQFRQRLAGLSILDPVQFLIELRRALPEAFEAWRA